MILEEKSCRIFKYVVEILTKTVNKNSLKLNCNSGGQTPSRNRRTCGMACLEWPLEGLRERDGKLAMIVSKGYVR